MPTSAKIIVIAGANGQLGGLLCESILARAARDGENVLVRALVRKGSNVPAPTANLVYEAIDYSSDADLARVCEDAFTFISALIGVEDVIIDIQTRLLKTAIAVGARRFIPSDFSGDFTKLPEGSQRNFDMRRRFHGIAARLIADARSTIEFTSIFQGGFTELLASGWVLFNYNKRQIIYFGSPDIVMDLTTYRNTAEYTAAVALDNQPTPAVLHIAGTRLSPRSAVMLAKKVTGSDFALKRIMSLGMLRLVIGILKRVKPDRNNTMPLWVGMQYGYVGALGLMSPKSLQNDRYDGIEWTGPNEIIAEAFKTCDKNS